MGAFALFAFLGHNLTDHGVYQTERRWQRASSWRRDHFEVFTGPKGETAVSWRIRLADRQLVGELAQELQARTALHLRAKQRGDELEILASDSPPALKSWQSTVPERCATED